MRSRLRTINGRHLVCHPEGACVRTISEILRLRRARICARSTPLRTRRRKYATSCSGSMSIALAIVAPLLVAMLALVVNVGTILFARAKLQVAVDRGVYAGAASIAHDMNRIARANWEIHSEYARREDWMNATSERSEGEVAQRFAETRARQSALRGRIRGINSNMYGRAVGVANNVVNANVPSAVFDPFFDAPEEGMMSIGPDDEHYGYISGADIEGATYDPDSYDVEAPEAVLRFVEKNDGRTLYFGGKASSESPTPIFPSLFGGSTVLRAVSGAQPYGGSIRSFAQVNPMGDNPPDLIAKQYLYRVAFVPVHTVTVDEPSSLH